MGWYCRSYAKGDHCLGSLHHQDQDYCSPRKEILCLDQRIHLGFPLHLPTDVDHQARVRRVRPIHCPQEVLLTLLANMLIFVQFSLLKKKYIDRFVHSVKKKKKKKKSLGFYPLFKKKKKKKKKKS